MYNKEEHFKVEFIEVVNGRERKRGKFFCILNGKTYNSPGGIRNAIKAAGYSVKEYYDKYYRLPDEGFCEMCGQEAIFKGLVIGYGKVCSIGCKNRHPDHIDIVSNRFVRNPEALESYRFKIGEYYNNLPDGTLRERRAKGIETTKRNHGDDYFKCLGKFANDILQEMCKEDPDKRRNIVSKMLDTKTKNGTFKNGMSGRLNEIEISGKNIYLSGV